MERSYYAIEITTEAFIEVFVVQRQHQVNLDLKKVEPDIYFITSG